MIETVGAVAIGRNEGERLERCLRSLVGRVACAVYVDSGSTDGSVAMARSMGVEVVELDMSIPFTAARARNAGLERLLQLAPNVKFVQVVDGDCEVVPGWLELAERSLREHADWAVVCGRRRERHPEASIYNRLCDIEWDTPVGEAKSCGGDAMMRISALNEVGGYDPAVIAGEEPELCVRLRRRGWRVHRLDAEMTLHDAAMTRFSQWWRRNVRAGHAYAEAYAMHGRPPERHGARQTMSIWLWGAVLPLVALVAALVTRGWGLLLLLAYPALGAKIYLRARKRGMHHADAWRYAMFCVIAKAPQLLGQWMYWTRRLRGRRSTIIEYKAPPARAGT